MMMEDTQNLTLSVWNHYPPIDNRHVSANGTP